MSHATRVSGHYMGDHMAETPVIREQLLASPGQVVEVDS